MSCVVSSAAFAARKPEWAVVGLQPRYPPPNQYLSRQSCHHGTHSLGAATPAVQQRWSANVVIRFDSVLADILGDRHQ